MLEQTQGFEAHNFLYFCSFTNYRMTQIKKSVWGKYTVWENGTYAQVNVLVVVPPAPPSPRTLPEWILGNFHM